MVRPTLKLALLGAMFSTNIIPAIADHGEAMKIQYYWDGNCKDYADYQIEPYADNPRGPSECRQFYVSGTWSANIANCYDNWACSCTFYVNDDCSDYPVETDHNTGAVETGVHPNCAHNNGLGFKSYKCFVYSNE